MLLRGLIDIHGDMSFITLSDLISIVSNYLLSRESTMFSADDQSNFLKNMDDCISIFPKLSIGLDVNVKFNE